MTQHPTLAVLGAGSWGTALAALTARNGVPTRLWGRDPAALAAMAAARCNQRYLPGIELPEALRYEPDLATAVHGAAIVLLVVPSHAFASMLEDVAPLLDAGAAIAWATKGFEPGTGRFLHELVAKRLPGSPAAVITGPSFAREVAAGLPSAVTVHSEDAACAQRVANLLHAPNLRAYTGGDMLGAELGGAMKNVLAVATGIADGMNLGLNARAGLITRGMNEMLRLGVALGARPETLIGLSGLGDLVLTCTGDLSRNRRLGLALGKGIAIDEAVRQIGQVVESVLTADEVARLADQHALDLPISAGVRAVLHGEVTPAEGLKLLMAREQKPEYPRGLFGNA
ncbi:MAG: glycerol-3-phosphate dehydrogenase [Rhodanobacter sp. 68-29]|uniref:NAD(P)H-dependent glycerol-3-phosphate dehydrogenase n=1 Tax=Rhodanobacter sp. PCA2 TaxID=2006117 RepID=UPI0009264135|nr:NAD(P)H-dependent glycerol-3-phosphate dehydrogenase [Rhodanobacter sp. PCA2]MBA2079696.1 glycerol-3-phosphate dehydrogenase [Rhodanobacter sp. PCA2]MBN8923651.1 NAD(P)-dependent glycerol-3-phosphate dehydrogenase [Rhodanobacter sp.]OJY56823.1 MAG: glycerol-3-phosphate dehydrogenase [Rhodanobacter sp. 68-29]